LLDAILGFITIEQNDLFKVLTVVSVVGIPPTVVAGIYGMNFKFMPELAWQWGYPFGLALILLSAFVPLMCGVAGFSFVGRKGNRPGVTENAPRVLFRGSATFRHLSSK
jgi:hypothetical protein